MKIFGNRLLRCMTQSILLTFCTFGVATAQNGSSDGIPELSDFSEYVIECAGKPGYVLEMVSTGTEKYVKVAPKGTDYCPQQSWCIVFGDTDTGSDIFGFISEEETGVISCLALGTDNKGNVILRFDPITSRYEDGGYFNLVPASGSGDACIIQVPSGKKKASMLAIRDDRLAVVPFNAKDKTAWFTFTEAFDPSRDNTLVAEEYDGCFDNDLVDCPATYPGGAEGVFDFITENTEYPASALAMGLGGSVIMKFEVKEDGTVGRIKIIKGLSKDCDDAVAQAVSKLGRFTPAKHQGRTVSVWYRLSVRFLIDEGKCDAHPVFTVPRIVDDVEPGNTIDDLKVSQFIGGTTVPPAEEEIFDNAIVECPATYPGGESAILSFIAANLVYPASALDTNLQGVVILKFEIKKDGSIGKIKIIKSLSRDCDKAAATVISKLKRFTPAKQQGHAVPVWFTLPVRFSIQ